jgi:hypothetical protein
MKTNFRSYLKFDRPQIPDRDFRTLLPGHGFDPASFDPDSERELRVPNARISIYAKILVFGSPLVGRKMSGQVRSGQVCYSPAEATRQLMPVPVLLLREYLRSNFKSQRHLNLATLEYFEMIQQSQPQTSRKTTAKCQCRRQLTCRGGHRETTSSTASAQLEEQEPFSKASGFETAPCQIKLAKAIKGTRKTLRYF